MKMLPALMMIGAMAALLWPITVMAMPLPDCAGDVAITEAKIVRVEKNGVLILNDGRAVILEGLRLPGTDRPAAPVAQQALAELRALALGKGLTLTATHPKNDRYGRMRVQAFGSVWLQTELLKQGLARVSIPPDRQECSPDFYEAETEARNAGRGVWAVAEFAVRPAQPFLAPSGSFQLVQGRIVNITSHDGRVFLDFSEDYRKGFSATVAPEDRKAFRDSDPALEELVGREVRLRGIVEDFNGRREMALSNPRQIEILK
ncbi:MAG: thermonuclease family protein [Pseudomonadota bacterium]